MGKDEKTKILRIGIIQGGRIVEERLLRRRDTVTVGHSARNTFIIPTGRLPKSYTLFEVKGGKYSLLFDERIEGRVSVGEQVLDLKALARSGMTQKRAARGGGGDPTHAVELDERSRGKVLLGEFTLLFQFVDAPPVVPKPQLPAAARGGFRQHFDLIFAMIIIASFLLQGGFGVGMDVWWRQSGRYMQTQYGERRVRAYEVLKAEVQRQNEVKEEEAEIEDSDDAKETDEETPESAKPDKKDKRPTKPSKKEVAEEVTTPTERASRTRKRMQEKVRKETFLYALGSANTGEDGEVSSSPLKALDATKVKNAFDKLGETGLTVADKDDQATFVGNPKAVKSGSAGYKRLAKGEGGAGQRIATKQVKTSSKKKDKVKIRIKGSNVSGQSGTGTVDKSSVTKVFKRRKGAIKHCYEKGLQKNPNLKGKVKIRFTIGTAGRITKIDVQSNSTGDSSVGNCIKTKVKSWKFPAPEGGSVTFSYPFVLAQG
jgi:TonB family protein